MASLAFPQIFLIVAPANLLVDCLVLTLALMGLKHKNKWAVVKKLGLKFWWWGFVADFIGMVLLLPGVLLPFFFPHASWADDISASICSHHGHRHRPLAVLYPPVLVLRQKALST